MNPIGEILPADENFHHQITETFASVVSSDPCWTEKVCAMAMKRDGSMQIGFGLGKYINRNVMDGYAAISVGREQSTVRVSRRLAPNPDLMTIGPLSYEVVEPLQAIRFVLEANDAQELSFDVLFEGVIPPCAEERTHLRQSYRLASELVRYHQIGKASGWIKWRQERVELSAEDWISTRDHSWGPRYDVGQPLQDIEPGLGLPEGSSFMMIWCPALMQDAQGESYGLHLHFTWVRVHGFEQKMVTAKVERPNGAVEQFVELVPELRFDPDNRRLLGGKLLGKMADGSKREIIIEALGDTGVQLGAGLYFGLDGHYHGEWRGELHVEGEHVKDCATPEQARRHHQIRDTAVRIRDLAVDGEGVGNCQPIAYGPWPEFGLDAEWWI